MNLGKPFKKLFRKKTLKKIAPFIAVGAAIWGGIALAGGAAATKGAVSAAAGGATGGGAAGPSALAGGGTGGLAAQAAAPAASSFPAKTAATVGGSAALQTANRAAAAGAPVPTAAQPPAAAMLAQNQPAGVPRTAGFGQSGLTPEAQTIGGFSDPTARRGPGLFGGGAAGDVMPGPAESPLVSPASAPGAGGGLGASIIQGAKAGADWFEELPTIVQLGFLQGAQGLFAPDTEYKHQKRFYKWRQNQFAGFKRQGR